MAVMSQGILGGLSGKIGNVVGSSWKGISVLKTKPLSVANPRTTAQVNQRNSMDGAVFYATIILATVIKPLWDRFAVKMSGYNEWISMNIAQFTDRTTFNAASLVMSKGKMVATPITVSTVSNGSKSVSISGIS